MKWFLLFIIPIVAQAVDREDIWRLLNPKSDELSLEAHKYRMATQPYHLDLDGDEVDENVLFTYGDGHYYISLLNGSEFLGTHKIRVEGGESKIQRFHLEDIGNGYSTLLIFIKEGSFTTINNVNKRRVDLVTFKRSNLKKSYYYEGPLVSYSANSWDETETVIKSYVFFKKFPFRKSKSLLIEDDNFSLSLKWSEAKKTWY